jgi:hypothetical protein
VLPHQNHRLTGHHHFLKISFMSSPIPSLLSLCLIGSGTALALFAGRLLVSNPELNPPLNPLGINGSPYGEVFAMAMQGPIDTYFHVGMDGVGHQHGPEADHDHSKCEGRHEPTNGPRIKPVSTPALANVGKRFGNLLTSMGEARETRTNPYAATEAHKRHIRRQVEDKLRFANRLDPANYGNYVGLHFFLTEPGIASHPQLLPVVANLADDTIHYCLKEMDDPRPALTAAAAAANMLHVMFADEKSPNPTFNVKQMRYYMTVLDTCIARYQNLSTKWLELSKWSFISTARIAECEDRIYFVSKIRDAAESTVTRLETKSLSTASQ